MKVYGWSATKLARVYSVPELIELREKVRKEHYAPNGIYLYDKKGQRKLEAIGWAIYYHHKGDA
ncbi:hypothetical protein [Orrella marina]|uniref:Uncharacterized protein n=1 Tax=Orrella marina TaxID=2163011 RepID=A0A2R4XNX8_9BURK|nr:hypothetical protein [Orrella marina]AWB35513.1 hypothetical protein DBV39_19165 [Orrella marina]